MLISIIIPTCNRYHFLLKCLSNLSSIYQNVEATLYEILVTDDSLDDVSKNLVEEQFKWIRYVRGPKKGPAANRNHGAKLAKGEWLIFLDDDCLPQKKWLSTYLVTIQNNDEILVLEGATIADRPKQRFDEESPINTKGDNLWSCNFAIKKTLFYKLNGFDESFPFAAMEDVDFYNRVKQCTSTLFIPQALVIHPWRRQKLFKSFNKHLKSHMYYVDKYHLNSTISFRIKRTKIFVGTIIFGFKELVSLSMRGWPAYIEKCILNFCLIFI